MPDNARWGRASFPGVRSVIGCTYTCSHGVSPGVAVLRMLPQATLPDAYGDLLIFDGTGTVRVPGCKVDAIKVEHGPNGTEWHLEIVDRRWRWRDLGILGGCYNQLDDHGKLVPFMVRSPLELALLCLAAMGERNYQIDLPPGLTSAAAVVGNRFLLAGENFAATGVNPSVNWDAETPAMALQRLAETFGRRVVYSLANDSVLIARPGIGAALPAGSLAREGPTLRLPQQPDGVAVVGSPTKYQARFELEPIGEEYDGSFRPIDQLSYAPLLPGLVQISEVDAEHAVPTTSPGSLALTVTFAVQLPGRIRAQRGFTAVATTGMETAADLLDAIKDEYDAVGVFDFLQAFTLSLAGSTLTVTGLRVGQSFSVTASYSFPDASLGTTTCSAVMVRAASPDRTGWDFCGPPLFPGVRATARLTRFQAMALAQKSVFRMYRLSGRDGRGEGPISIPGYGVLVRKQQAVLLDTKVEQITPQPLDGALRDLRGQPFVVNFYNGYSRDMPAAVYGSVARYLGNARYVAARGANTPDYSQVFVDFSIDQTWQMVVFSQAVYRVGDGGRLKAAELVLETGCNVRNPLTNQLECYTAVRPLGGNGAGVHAEKRPDVQLNVYGVYNVTHQLTATRLLEADALERANYYLSGLSLQYLVQGGQVAEYNGIVPVACDGAVFQVTWEVGEGARTIASRNSEHSTYVPPYPARRRAEALRPAEANALFLGAQPQRINPAGGQP